MGDCAAARATLVEATATRTKHFRALGPRSETWPYAAATSSSGGESYRRAAQRNPQERTLERSGRHPKTALP